jgi:hypothetical protein
MPDRKEFERRQRALADFGQFVLDHDDLHAILTEACRLIAFALGAEFATIVEIDREGNTGLIRAGIGWGPDIVGQFRLDLSQRSSEAYAIHKVEPVITNDITAEDRDDCPMACCKWIRPGRAGSARRMSISFKPIRWSWDQSLTGQTRSSICATATNASI